MDRFRIAPPQYVGVDGVLYRQKTIFKARTRMGERTCLYVDYFDFLPRRWQLVSHRKPIFADEYFCYSAFGLGINSRIN